MKHHDTGVPLARLVVRRSSDCVVDFAEPYSRMLA
jgi:hypothetical protein